MRNGRLDERLSQRSAKPSTPVRIGYRPHSHIDTFKPLCPVDRGIFVSVSICRSLELYVQIGIDWPDSSRFFGSRLFSSRFRNDSFTCHFDCFVECCGEFLKVLLIQENLVFLVTHLRIVFCSRHNFLTLCNSHIFVAITTLLHVEIVNSFTSFYTL